MFPKLKYLTLIVLIVFPLAADAQQRRGGGRARAPQPPDRTPRAEALAPPQQLSQVLLPAGARRVNERVLLTRDGRWVSHDRQPQRHRPWWKPGYGQYPIGGYYATPYGGYGYGYEVAAETREEAAPAPVAASTIKGLLQFDITPATGLEYYIDGMHIGSSSTLGSEFEVNAGARQVEVRARGYHSATFDKRIEEGRVTVVRGALEPMPHMQAPANGGKQVMYVIPGCYMGNSKPSPEALPAGCDIRKLVTRGL
jgi:hypothetical protein